MKKAAMWIVSLLIICGLMTGCGGSASKFAGSYKGTVDMTDVYRQDFEDFTGVPSEASCSVEVTLTLAEEDKQKTFTMSADPEVIKQAISDEIDSRAEEVFNAIMESMDVRQEQYPQIVETMDEYDTVEEMILPALKKVVEGAHEAGVIFEFHSCGMIEPLVPLIVEAGADLWDGQIMNDKASLSKTYRGKLGIEVESPIQPDMADEEARERIKELLEQHAPGIFLGKTFRADPRLTPIAYEESRNMYCS